MMGYKTVYCQNLKQKNVDTAQARHVLRAKRKCDLVGDLVDPICVITNANEILYCKLAKFLDAETRTYFEMIGRAATKSKTLVEEIRNEDMLIE
jgi:hypothetical protein